MRIGLFTDQFSVGISGQTTSVMMLYNYFKKNGHACYIFTSHTHKLADDNPDIINLPGVPYPKKNMREYRFSLFVKRHSKLIEACRIIWRMLRWRRKNSWGSRWFTRCIPCGNTILTI